MSDQASPQQTAAPWHDRWLKVQMAGSACIGIDLHFTVDRGQPVVKVGLHRGNKAGRWLPSQAMSLTLDETRKLRDNLNATLERGAALEEQIKHPVPPKKVTIKQPRKKV